MKRYRIAFFSLLRFLFPTCVLGVGCWVLASGYRVREVMAVLVIATVRRCLDVVDLSSFGICCGV
jgi:hypothetical protein